MTARAAPGISPNCWRRPPDQATVYWLLLSPRLAGLTVPTLVVWGAADRMFRPAYGQEYAAAIPGAAFRQLPDAGHLPQLEAPEAVLALLADAAFSR